MLDFLCARINAYILEVMVKLLAFFNKIKLTPPQVVAAGFLTVILVGAILLNTPFVTNSGESIGFENAVFTSTSAVCVTGLVVVDTGTYWNYAGKTIIIILIQIGGLGFMTMASLLALIAGRKFSLKERILMQESMGAYNISGIVRLTKYAAMMTFLFEAIGAFALSFRFIPLYGNAKGIYYSIFHSISAFCNAGFDIMGGGKSLMDFATDPLVSFTICFLIIFGGLGFVVILELLKFKSPKHWTLNSKIVVSTTLALLIAGFVLFFALEYNNPATIKPMDFGGKLIASFFGSVTPRTAGFNTVDTAQLMPATLMMTMVFMFIGGSPSSTAGGVKTTTIAVISITVVSILRGKSDSEAYGRRITRQNVNKAIAILGIAMFVLVSVISLLSISEVGQSFFDIVFEAISAFGTVGLSVGLSAQLSVFGKIIMSITMFLGRVGALTMLFAATTKLKENQRFMMRFPEEKLTIG